MRQFFCILVALMLSPDGHAGVKRWEDPNVAPQQSAALFVGVRDFKYDKIAPVPYAVDDAVDLAFEVAIVQRPPLVPPKRVALALSGQPQKPQSQQRLKELIAAGASLHRAGHSEILQLLETQSRSVGKNGILIVAFATHGVSEGGTQYLLTAESLLKHRGTTLADAAIREVVSANAPRSLILFDACRERLTRDRRAGDPDPRSVAAFGRAMRRIEGQAVISAAAEGDYAYDDDERRNGVFTAAVLDALRCGAAKDHGFVTVDTLHSYVSRAVLKWIQDHKDPGARKATQLQCEGESKKMPLSICVSRTASASRPLPE